MPRIRFPRFSKLISPAFSGVDDTLPPIQVDSYPNIRGSIGLDAFDEQSVLNLNQIFKGDDGRHYFERLQRVEDGLKTIEETDALDMKSLLEFAKTPRKDLITTLSKVSDTNVKSRELFTRMQSHIDNLYNTGGVGRAIRSFFNNDLRAIETQIKESGARLENQIVMPLRQAYGSEAASFTKLLTRKPEEFKKVYGVDQGALLAALLDPEDANAILGKGISSDFVTSTKRALSELNTRFKEQGVPLNLKNNKHTIPFSIPTDVLGFLSPDEFVSLLQKHTNLEDKGIEAIIMDYSRIRDTGKDLKLNVSSRDFKFKSGADAYNFFKAVRGWSENDNVVGEYFNAIRNSNHQRSLYLAYGEQPKELILRATNTYKREGKLTREQAKSLDEHVNNYIARLNEYNRTYFKHDATTKQATRLVSNMVGFFIGTPASAVQRNHFIDFEGHAAAAGQSLYNSKYHMGHAFQGTVKSLGYLLGSLFKRSEQRKGVDAILNIMGLANQFDALSFANLGLFENVVDAPPAMKAGRSLLNKANNVMFNLSSSLYKWSGNNSLVDSRRARSITSFQQMWTNTFDQYNNFDDWFKMATSRNERQARQMLGTWGIGKREWEFLKRANRLKLEIEFDKAVTDTLGFEKVPDFLTRESIKATDNKIAKAYKASNETEEQFKEKVGYLWNRLVYNTMGDHVPLTTYTDSITSSAIFRIPVLDVLARLMLKYSDPANTQWVNLRDRIATNVYGDTSQFVGFDKSLLHYSKALATYTAFAAAVLWVKDVGSGRKPRDFTDPRQILPLMSSTGFGGVYNMIATQLLNVYDNVGTSSITGTPLGGGLRKSRNIIRAAMDHKSPTQAFDLARYLSASSGVGNLWGVKGLAEYTFRKTLLTPAQNDRYLRRLEKKYGKEALVR